MQRVALVILILAMAWPSTAKSADVGGLKCLILNVYHEARGESYEGRVAVAWVTLNRVRSKLFPNTICEVVKQGSMRRGGGCQFSWWCDGKDDRAHDDRAWMDAVRASLDALSTGGYDPTGGAMWYHAVGLKPVWRTRLNKGPVIGRHVFYMEK